MMEKDKKKEKELPVFTQWHYFNIILRVRTLLYG